MPTQAELDKAKAQTRNLRAENRELAEMNEALEAALEAPPPVIRRVARRAAGDLGAAAQGVAEATPIAGPLTLGHVTLGLAFLGRSATDFLAEDPYSVAAIAIGDSCDGAVKGAIGIRTYKARQAAIAARDNLEAQAVQRERDRQEEKPVNGSARSEPTPSPQEKTA